LPIKLGDANLDGFPDLLFIVLSPSYLSRTPKLLFSGPCTKGLGGCDKNGEGRRGFQFVTKGAETLEAVQDARGVSFFDMDHGVRVFLMVLYETDTDCMQGTIDIVLQRSGRQKQGSVLFVQNNFYYDAFFLTAIGDGRM